MSRFFHRLLQTEPVRLVAFVEALAGLVLVFTDVISVETWALIVAAVVPTHELIRSLVVSPATDEARSAQAIADYLGEPSE